MECLLYLNMHIRADHDRDSGLVEESEALTYRVCNSTADHALLEQTCDQHALPPFTANIRDFRKTISVS